MECDTFSITPQPVAPVEPPTIVKGFPFFVKKYNIIKHSKNIFTDFFTFMLNFCEMQTDEHYNQGDIEFSLSPKVMMTDDRYRA